MKFTPKYTVSYHGAFHPAGKPFDIAAEDAEEMRKHGTVEAADELDEPPAPAKKFTCPYCGKEYKSEESLNKHIKDKHPEASEPQE